MRQLYQDWTNSVLISDDSTFVETAPAGFDQMAPISRTHTMEDPEKGVRYDVPSEEAVALATQGWRLRLGQQDFLELVHLQAWYFQVRFFPRLKWIILDAPAGRHFVIGDRPVVWGFDGHFEDPPSALRNPAVQLVAPLSRSLALFACHHAATPPVSISYAAVNQIIASAAQEWIAGPTRAIVAEALSLRS